MCCDGRIRLGINQTLANVLPGSFLLVPHEKGRTELVLGRILEMINIFQDASGVRNYTRQLGRSESIQTGQFFRK